MVCSPVLVSLVLLTGGATTSNARWLDPVTPATAAQSDEAKKLVEEGDAAKVREAISKWEAASAHLAAGVPMVMAVKKAPKEASEAHFKKSLEVAPNYLGTKVLWAQFLCPKTGDKALAKKLLEEAVAADPSDQHKAKTLLANFDSLFAL